MYIYIYIYTYICIYIYTHTYTYIHKVPGLLREHVPDALPAGAQGEKRNIHTHIYMYN